MKQRNRPFGYGPIGGTPMYPCIHLNPSEVTGIIHISRIHKQAFSNTVFYNERSYSTSGRRREDEHKL